MYLIALAICLVIGGFVGWSLKPDKKCPEIAGTTVQTDSIPVIHDSISYVPYPVVKLQKVNVDSIYQVAKKYWEQFYDNAIPVDYIAKSDTTLNDPNLSGDISFVSRIPLDPNAFFRTNLTVKEKTITKTVIQTEEVGFFYKRFIPYLGIGLSYNGTTVEPTIQLGFGIRIN
jgi:hypothetical protein